MLISDVISRRLGMLLLGQGSRRDRKRGRGGPDLDGLCRRYWVDPFGRVVLAMVDPFVSLPFAFGISLMLEVLFASLRTVAERLV